MVAGVRSSWPTTSSRAGGWIAIRARSTTRRGVRRVLGVGRGDPRWCQRSAAGRRPAPAWTVTVAQARCAGCSLVRACRRAWRNPRAVVIAPSARGTAQGSRPPCSLAPRLGPRDLGMASMGGCDAQRTPAMPLQRPSARARSTL
jgi:hypothetical protein